MEQYEKIIHKTWEDSSFKSRFMENPKAVLAEMGQPLTEDVTLEVHDNSTDIMHFVLLDKTQARSVNLEADPILGKITRRALEDEAFKKKLIAEPKATIREILGVEPQGNICVHANTENHIHLVLPANPNITGDLSDADLAVVSGGKGGSTRNALTCGTMDAFFSGLEVTFGVGTYGAGGFIGALSVALGPLLTGGHAFADAASSMSYTKP
ncbi:MAG: nitrile hydratase subunit alpha [SAR324 cluster bacterium]|nr:nitrile hydratase subunit alpha [SAR324 cluster bacterium]